MKMAAERGYCRFVLVGLELYTRRALATARKLGWHDFYWLSVYSAGGPAHGLKWLQTHSRGTILCHDMIVSLCSKLVGWI